MNKDIKQVIEGLLFLSGESGITEGEIINIINVDAITVQDTIEKLRETYRKNNHIFEIIYTSQSYKLATKKEYGEFFQKYADVEYVDNLSSSAMETLAIIAYNQPVTRYTIEEIKGVSPYSSLQTLLTKNLIEIVGRSNEIGRPNIYGVSESFFDYLGINTIGDLPELKEFELKIKEKDNQLFDEVDDFKTVRNRLLEKVEFEERKFDVTYEEIAVPEVREFEEQENGEKDE